MVSQDVSTRPTDDKVQQGHICETHRQQTVKECDCSGLRLPHTAFNVISTS